MRRRERERERKATVSGYSRLIIVVRSIGRDKVSRMSILNALSAQKWRNFCHQGTNRRASCRADRFSVKNDEFVAKCSFNYRCSFQRGLSGFVAPPQVRSRSAHPHPPHWPTWKGAIYTPLCSYVVHNRAVVHRSAL